MLVNVNLEGIVCTKNKKSYFIYVVGQWLVVGRLPVCSQVDFFVECEEVFHSPPTVQKQPLRLLVMQTNQ